MSFLERLVNKVSNVLHNESLRNSGAEWIGAIPQEWGISKIGSLYTLRNQKVSDKDYPPLSVTKNGVVPQLSTAAKTDDGDNRKLVRVGDFVINSRSDRRGSCGISQYDGSVSLINTILTPRGKMHPGYYNWLFHTTSFADEFYKWGHGIVDDLWTTRWQEMKRILVPVPPYETQNQIALFLEGYCSKINAIISEAKTSIEEYKSWKASIIYEAVTKGLVPDVEMKDSGVEWIGKMPVHWRLIPFRYVLQERNERNTSVISKERLSLSIDLGVTLYADKTTNLDRFKEDFSQYKLAYEGDLVMNSMNMIVGASGVSSWFGCVSPAYYTFYDTIEDHVTAKFCEYIFRNKAILRVLHSLGKGIYSIERGDDRVNTCRLKVSKDDLKKILIPIPTVEEQRKIVRYLEDKCTMLDTLVNEKQSLIAELEAYKKSLIFEVVTGKRRVV